MAEGVSKKIKGGFKIKNEHVKNYLKVFINCLIADPKFDSQGKEKMSKPRSAWDKSNTCILPESSARRSLPPSQKTWSRMFGSRQDKELEKEYGKSRTRTITDIEKLEDANLAGSERKLLPVT